MPPTRTDLARRGMLKADEVRDRFDIPPHSAVNVFDLCGERFNPAILVRFKDISMEGMYLRQAKPEFGSGFGRSSGARSIVLTSSATTSLATDPRWTN